MLKTYRVICQVSGYSFVVDELLSEEEAEKVILDNIESDGIASKRKKIKYVLEEERPEDDITADLYISRADVAEALAKQNISITAQNISKVANHLKNIASAWAKATLQDEDDWLQWIEESA